MNARLHTHRQWFFVGVSLLFLFTLLLAACGTGSNPTPTPEPTGIKPGSQPCPATVKDPAHWDSIIGTKSGLNQVERVSCANVMNSPSLQALIAVRYSGTDSALDVYVYTNIASSQPKLFFKLQRLMKGDAKISGYNTLMTAEVDTHSS